MLRGWLALFALVLIVGVGAPNLFADHGWDRDKDNGRGKHFRDDEHGRRGDRDDRRRDFREDRHHRDRDDDRWDRRGSYEYRTFDRDGRPPGWVRGHKVGWTYCGLPPGQAKKYGCYSYMYQRRRYYYYYNDIGQIIIRRPTVIVHAGVDIVQ